jgi:NADPH-dependent 2,4-dienoyl-CoA reductase/sulfur reductase-like enzyme/rhodanese-related sulfurtransferase
MKVVVIGGVAAGPKVAAKLKRNNPEAEVIVIEKGEFLSYAGCGLPYYISGVVKEQSELMETPTGVVRDGNFFKKVKDFTVLNHTEATKVDSDNKTVTVVNKSGEESVIEYDKLVFATGAKEVRPPFPGIDLPNVFSLKEVEDAEAIKNQLKEKKALDVAIVGGGLIGVEVAEALTDMGCRVTIVELLPQILTIVDPEIAAMVTKHFCAKGVKIRTNTKVMSFEGDGKVQKVITDKGEIPVDMVIVSIGVRPNVELAKNAGVEIGSTGAIKVNKFMETSVADIYAAGDCAEKVNIITNAPAYVPLGSTANKEGRVVANRICGINDEFSGILGSAVCKVFDFSVARTGLGEKQARDVGYDVVTSLTPAPDKPHFMPDAKPLMLKLIADRKTRKVLGAQSTGPGDGDKRINVVATAITAGMTVDQLAQIDLCYAPPFSPAVDNILTAANVLRNKIDGLMDGITSAEVKAKIEANEDILLLDVRGPAELEQIPTLPGAINIPLGALRTRLDELDKSKNVIAFCKISLRGYEAALILKQAGFKNVKVMDGGVLMYPHS